MPRIEDAGERLDRSTTAALAKAEAELTPKEPMSTDISIETPKPVPAPKPRARKPAAKKAVTVTPERSSKTAVVQGAKTVDDVVKLMQSQRVKAFEAQEKSRASRLMVDTTYSLIFGLVLALIGLLTAFVVSYSTLVSVAGWMLLEQQWLAYIVPAFIEAMIVFSTLDYIIARSRGASTLAPYLAIVGFSTVAVIGNFAHSLSGWMERGEIPWYGYVGILLSALVPLVVVYLSKRVTAIVFSEPIKPEDQS